MQIGAPRKIAEYFREQFPGTMVTETLIRRLMDSGEIPYINNGVKRLTSVEAVQAYLEAKLGGGANV